MPILRLLTCMMLSALFSLTGVSAQYNEAKPYPPQESKNNDSSDEKDKTIYSSASYSIDETNNPITKKEKKKLNREEEIEKLKAQRLELEATSESHREISLRLAQLGVRYPAKVRVKENVYSFIALRNTKQTEVYYKRLENLDFVEAITFDHKTNHIQFKFTGDISNEEIDKISFNLGYESFEIVRRE